MADLADYERAIVLSFELVQSPSKTQEQRLMQSEASLYCERIENSPQGWRMTLSLLRTTRRAEVKFFCLQSMQKLLSDNEKYAQLPLEDKLAIRSAFLGWVGETCTSLPQEQRFVKSKLGVVIALLIKREFPTTWMSAFDDLLQLLPIGPGGADVLILTLSALDEEAVSIGGAEAMVIKDAMRVSAVGKIVNALGTIAAVYEDTEVDLVKRCWWVCGMYVDWIDINLTTEERFLRTWFAHCVDHRYRANAVAALNRLVQKGMDSSSKLRLIHQLGLADACVDLCVRSGSTQAPPQEFIAQPTSSAWALCMSQLPREKLMASSAPPSPSSSGSVAAIVSTTTQPDEEQFTVEAARFCQSLGIQLLECRKTFVLNVDLNSLDSIRPAMDRALFCLFAFMGRSDRMEVQSSVLEFANRIVTSNKEAMPNSVALNGKKELLAERANYFGPEAIHRMLFAVLSCVRLPVEFNLNSIDSSLATMTEGGGPAADHNDILAANDDEESEFREHRGNVKRLFLNLVRCSSVKAVLPFLRTVAEQCLAAFSPKQPPHDVEAVLYMIHAFGEGAPEVSQRQGLPEDIEGFDQLILIVFRSAAFQGPTHPVIANMYNELAARYVVALRAQSVDLISHVVVDRVVGPGGIHHPSSKVRTRAASLLLRIVRALENSCAPFSERILLGLRDVLDLSFDLCHAHYQTFRKQRGSGRGNSVTVGGGSKKPCLKEPDVILIYETVGLLLGSPVYCPDENQRRVYLRAVVGPLQINLDQACTAVTGALPFGKAEVVVHWAACQMEALASLAKGFALQSDTPDILELWKEVLRTCIVATVNLESLAATTDPEFLVSNLRRLCHSMIRTIGTEILVFFGEICQALLEAPTADICRALPLLNQMMSAFKGKMHQSLVSSLLPILRATNARIAPVANRPQPTVHDREELIAMEKELFTFLMAVASTSELASVFYDGPNRNHIEELLRMITDGMASVPDAAVQRICAATLLALCKEWLSPQSRFPEDLRPAFVQFAFERITPASFQATAQPHFDHNDAACSTLLVMICTLHRALFELCGQDWIEYVRRVFLPSVNCPASTAEEYCQAVAVTKNPKDLRAFFRKLFLDDVSKNSRQ